MEKIKRRILKKYSNHIHAFIDGGYKNGKTTYGIVYIYKGEIIKRENGILNKKYIDCSSRNIAGELIASVTSIKKAYKADKNIVIYHDYIGVSEYAKGSFKTSDGTTQRDYKNFYDKAKKSMDIVFVKVKAHSGNRYNNMADNLATEARENTA